MSAPLADTFFFLALLSQSSPAHARALAALRSSPQILTSEFTSSN